MIDIDEITADIREFAPDFTFKLVLTNAAVAGIPQASPEAKFAIANPNTSFCWWNLVFVILSAIFAEMIVSNIPTIAIANAANAISFTNSSWLQNVTSVFPI